MLTSGRGTSGGSSNFSSGFLPSHYQGTVFRNSGEPILYLSNPDGVSDALQEETLRSVRRLNEMRFEATGDLEIASRISSYELAYRMQMSAPELLDFSDEPGHVLDGYGVNSDDEGQKQYATNCLLARRMVERGVRFVLMMDASWDDHSGLNENLAEAMPEGRSVERLPHPRPQAARPSGRDACDLGRGVRQDSHGGASPA